jgi:hypothetical protein
MVGHSRHNPDGREATRGKGVEVVGRGSRRASYTEIMPVTIELPAEVHARLSAEAARRGITLDQLIAALAEHLPARRTETPRRKLAFVGAGASKEGISHQIDKLLADGFGRD